MKRFIVVHNSYSSGRGAEWAVIDTELGVVANAYNGEVRAEESASACNAYVNPTPTVKPYDYDNAERNFARKVKTRGLSAMDSQKCL